MDSQVVAEGVETKDQYEYLKAIGCDYIQGYYETDTKIREYWVNAINDTLKKIDIPINVYVGNEIYVTENMDEMLYHHEVSTLNNSRYALFELPMKSSIKYMDEIVFKIFNLGYVPVLAHPERYQYIQKNIEIAEQLYRKGVLLQANYGSVLGLYGDQAKKTLIKKKKKDYIDVIASDVHKRETIYQVVEESKNKMRKIVGAERLEKLTSQNPKNIIQNQEVETIRRRGNNDDYLS